MPMITITKGGITTEVPRGELDWYKRNGWEVPGEAQAEPAPEPEAVTPAEDAADAAEPAKKKPARSAKE